MAETIVEVTGRTLDSTLVLVLVVRMSRVDKIVVRAVLVTTLSLVMSVPRCTVVVVTAVLIIGSQVVEGGGRYPLRPPN